MPKRGKNSENTQMISKKQQSGSPWYKRVRNIIIIALAVIIVGVGAWSLYYFPSRPYRQTAIKINGVSLDMSYFINMCKLYYGKAPTDSTIADFADFVEQQIEQGQKLIQGSKILGVQIPRSDIEKALSSSQVPITPESIDVWLSQNLVTDQVPTSQLQYNVQAMFLESEETAQIAIARLKAGEAFDVVTSALSKFPPSTIDTANLSWVTAREADLALSSSRFGGIISGAAVGVVSGPVYDDSVFKRFGYWVARVVELSNPSDNITPLGIHVEGILVGTEQEAKNIVDKINAGADINELAKQFSLVTGAKDGGADIGWIGESQDPSLFALSTRPLNTVVGPVSDNSVQTAGGYWVYNVLEKNDNMVLTSDQQDKLNKDLIDRCTAALEKDPKYKSENLLTQEMKDFALNQVVLAQGKGSILIGTNSLTTGEQGLNYYCKLKVYGEKKGNTWSIIEGSLPEGLSFDKSTGVISGIPRFGGGGGVTIKVENAIHFSTQELSYSIRIAVQVATDSLPDGKVGTAYSETLTAYSDVEAVAWSIIKGTLPDGLSLTKETGEISGTPTASGTFSFTVQADDGMGKGTKDLTIKVE
jgi:hypothetical protein